EVGEEVADLLLVWLRYAKDDLDDLLDVVAAGCAGAVLLLVGDRLGDDALVVADHEHETGCVEVKLEPLEDLEHVLGGAAVEVVSLGIRVRELLVELCHQRAPTAPPGGLDDDRERR